MENKQIIQEDVDKLTTIRKEIFNFLDKNIPKDDSGIAFDFSENPMLDAKSVYEYFYKLDYQARKLRGCLVRTYNLKTE